MVNNRKKTKEKICFSFVCVFYFVIFGQDKRSEATEMKIIPYRLLPERNVIRGLSYKMRVLYDPFFHFYIKPESVNAESNDRE